MSHDAEHPRTPDSIPHANNEPLVSQDIETNHSDTYKRAKQWLAMAGIATVLIGGGLAIGDTIKDRYVATMDDVLKSDSDLLPTPDNY